MAIRILENIVFPVFALAKDCGDVLRFDSASDMEYVEAIDVENEEYEAWDCTGRILRMTASNIGMFQSGDITVAATDRTADPTKLKRLTSVAKKVS